MPEKPQKWHVVRNFFLWHVSCEHVGLQFEIWHARETSKMARRKEFTSVTCSCGHVELLFAIWHAQEASNMACCKKVLSVTCFLWTCRIAIWNMPCPRSPSAFSRVSAAMQKKLPAVKGQYAEHLCSGNPRRLAAFCYNHPPRERQSDMIYTILANSDAGINY